MVPSQSGLLWMADDLTLPKEAGRRCSFPFFYGWVVVAVAFITMGIGVNSRTAFSLLFPPILDEFGWSRGSLAATFSIGFIISALITPAIGILMDRTGPRVVLPTGAVLVSFGLITATYSTVPWHFYLHLGEP